MKIKVLQIISGNDNGGGGNHVINLSYYSRGKIQCVIGTIGGGALYDKALEKGIEAVKFKVKDAYNGSIIEYVKQNNIDIVNFHGAKAFFMHIFLKNKLPIPSTATIHSDYRKDFLNNKIKYIFFTPLSVKGIRTFENYICVSKYLRNLLEQDKMLGRKFVVNNAINYDSIIINKTALEIREEYKIAKDDFVFVNIARMHPIKNHKSLIEAFYKLSRETNNVKLLLIGDGELEASIKEKVDNLNLKNKVIFTGFKENPVEIAAACDISILTSLSEGGSPPLVILESAAVNKSCICSFVGDIQETINEERGFLINPSDVEDIYLKMKQAYEDKDVTAKMGENLNDFCMKNYSMSNFCDSYYNAYKKILS